MEAYSNSNSMYEHVITQDADRTIEIDQIRREDVVQQLKLLGYNNVPDFLVQEFLDELRMSLSSSRHVKNENEYEYDSAGSIEHNNQRTRDIHLHSDGNESASSDEEHETYDHEQYHFNRPQAISNDYSEDEKENQEEFRHLKNTNHECAKHENHEQSNDNEDNSSYYEEEEEDEYEDEREEESNDIDHRNRGKGLYMYPPAVTQSLAHHAGYHRNLDERYKNQDRGNIDEEDSIAPSASSSNTHSSKLQAYEKTQFIARQNHQQEWSHGEDSRFLSETDTVDSRDSMTQPLVPPVYTYKRNIPTREERKPRERDPKLAQLQREKEELEKRKAFLEKQLLQQQNHHSQRESHARSHLIHNSSTHARATREHLPETQSPRAPSTARSTTSVPSTQTPRSSVVRYSHSGFGGRKPLTYRKKIHDPVSRYKQLQNVWQRDNFLTDHGSRKSLRWQVRQEMLQISGDTYASNL